MGGSPKIVPLPPPRYKARPLAETAAFDAAVKQYAAEHLTLRKGAMVLRVHKP
jgi:hypothetical protein